MKTKRIKPNISAGSMADIAFLLLIFFLVTTNIADEKGILVKLPAWQPEPISSPISTDRIVRVYINKFNEVMINDKPIEESKKVGQEVYAFLQQFGQSLSQSTPIVSLFHDRETRYEAYIEVYDQIKKAFRLRRDEIARQRFQKSMDVLPKQKQEHVRRLLPLFISEAEPSGS